MAETVKRASFAVEDMAEGGGNFFGANGPVRGQILSGKFTKEAPDGYNAQGNPIFAVVAFRNLAVTKDDGQSQEEYEQASRYVQSFSCGAAAGDNFTVSEDGDYLIPNDEHSRLVKTSKFGIFISSLQNEGVPKTVLQDFGFSKIVNLEGDWRQIADPKRDFADNRDSKKSKYPPTTLCLVKLHAMPGEKAKSAAPAAGKTTSASTSTPTPTTSTGPLTGEDLDNAAWPYLEQVLKEKSGTEQRGRLTLAVSKAAMKDPNRQAIARRAGEESYLNKLVELGVIAYAASDKGQPVSIAS